MNLELGPIDAASAPAFAGLVLGPLRAALGAPGDDRRVAIGARVDGEPAGAVVATIADGVAQAVLGSLVVARGQRRRGVGAALLAEVERVLAWRGVRELSLRHAPGKASTVALRRLLGRRAFEDLGPVTDVYRASAEVVARLPWLRTARLPAALECLPLADLADDERDALRAAGWYGPAWDPFAAAARDGDRARLGLALRWRGEVAGWILGSRVGAGGLLWHMLLVRHDLRGTGAGLALCAEALRRAAAGPAITRHDLGVDVANGPMQAFIAAAVAPHVPPPTRLHLWRKALPAPPPPSRAASTGYTSLVAMLRARAAERPAREAFTFLVDGTWDGPRRTLSTGELDRRARATAALLAGRCRPGERAVLLHPPGLDFLGALFGCFLAGVVAVPAYPPANRRHLPRLRAILADSGAALVLTTTPLAAEIAGWLADDGLPVPVVAADDLSPGLEDAWRERACGPDDVALLQYTSGSTTAPRGVVVPHGRLLHNLELNRRAGDLTADTRFVSWLPHFHDFGLVAGLLLPLFVDGTLVQLAPAAFLQRPALWLEAMSRARATFSAGPDFAYDLCARRVSPAQRAALDLSAWEIAVDGSEPVRPGTLARFAAAFAPCGFRPEAFMPCYGLAEATLTVTWSPRLTAARREVVSGAALAKGLVRPPDPEVVEDRRELVASGRTLGDLDARIVTPETGATCAPDEVGEVWVRGGGVCPGYFGQPEASARAFDARLADGSGPFLRTGDLGFARDGALFIVGRRDDVIIVRGRNHHPQDLEATLEGAHPVLRPRAAAAVGLARGDEVELAVVAEVERAAVRALDVPAVAGAARAALADAHGLELRRLVLVLPGALPRTSSGKTQRRAARDLLATGALEGVVGEWRAPADDAGSQAAAPLGPRARELEAWLTTRLGEQGLALDSLAALELLVAVEERLGVRLPPTLVTGASSVPALARTLEAAVRAQRGDDAGSSLERLRGATAAALALPAASMPVDAPLRELGLDSLRRVELALAWEEALGRTVPVDALRGELTLRQVAELVGRREHAGEPLTPPLGDGAVPLHPSQAELLRAARPGTHGVLLFLRAPPGLDVATLEAALRILERDHDALRLRFVRGDGGWVQTLTPPGGPIALERLDAVGLTPAALRARRADLLGRLRARVDLARGPLVAALLLDRGPAETGVLVLFAHHLVVDGTSLVLLVSHLTRACAAARGGQAAAPVAGGSYAAYCRALAAAGRPSAPGADAPPRPTARMIRHELDAWQSRALLLRFPGAPAREALLLASLVGAWSRGREAASATVWVQDHGRWPVGGVDPALTVGLFARTLALRVEVGVGVDQTRAALAAAREAAAPLVGRGRPDLAFEFRGELDALRGDPDFPVLDHATVQDPPHVPPAGLAMTAVVRRGRVAWTLATDDEHVAAIERIARDVLELLGAWLG